MAAVIGALAASWAATPALGASERGPEASSSASRSQLARSLDRRMRSAGSRSGAWFYDVGARKVLYERRPKRRLALASNTKLFTTATALDRFGAAARLRTEVWAAGALRDLDDAGGTDPKSDPSSGESSSRNRRYALDGDLYLRGGGDPAFGSGLFARRYLGGMVTETVSLAEKLKRAGITRVSGRLYADDTLFDRLRGVPYSDWRLTRYIGPLSALSYNSGFSGNTRRRFASDPAIVAAKQLKAALSRRGIRVSGAVRLRRLPRAGASRARIAHVNSPRMADLARETNRASNNFFAEMMLKGLGARHGKAGTTRSGAAVVRSFARRMRTGISAKDGSGLTRSNYASPLAVGRLLERMLSHRAKKSFLASLPVAGRHGTLRRRMRGTAAQDRCRAKTGTLRGVSTLSGYCHTRRGREVAFSILMNRVNPSSAQALQDRMLAIIANR